MERLILHIDMDAFFVSVEEALDPSLRGKPVIVGGNPNSRGVVASASYAARRYGIRSAMPLASARRLCPHAIFLRGNHRLYGEFSERIFNLLDARSPCMEPVSVDEAYLDLTGCERLHGPILPMAERIRNEIKNAVGINASIGKLVAKVASDCAKPSGMLWVAAGKEQTFLAPLPATRLPGVGPKSGERLKRMGVKTVGDLARLPRTLLEEVYGRHGTDLYQKARGQCDSPVAKREEIKSISRETTLAEDSADAEFLASTLSRLVEKAAAQLRASGLATRCVTLKLRYSDFTTVTHAHTLAEAVCEDHVIFRTAIELFKARVARRARVRLIGVGLASLAARGPEQTELFATASRSQWDRLYRGIDNIRAKYGFRSILRGTSWGGNFSD
ncbi:MAG: DNA polymerase IV [Nitrospinales bacterium]